MCLSKRYHLFVLAFFLLVSVSCANPTPFSLAPRHDLDNHVPSTVGKELQESGTTNTYRRWPESHETSWLESDRSRSLMILPPRDLSEVKQILRAIWYDFIPFSPDTLRQAAPVVKEMFSQIYDLVTTPGQRQLVEQLLIFSYGAFQMTIHCAKQSWDTIQEVVQYINEKIIGGMVGFFWANIILISGATITISYALIIGAIFWLAHIPHEIDWMRIIG